MKHTYAHRANLISKRFPNADRSASERLARDGELFALFQDQEQEKQSRQIQQPQQGNEFFGGGSTGDPGYSNLTEEEIKTGLGRVAYMTGNDYADFDPATFNKGIISEDTSTETATTKGGIPLSTYLNMGSGAIAAGSNFANILSLKDAKLVDPARVNPTFKFRGLDLRAYETALQNQLQTTNYGLLQSGADFDTVSGGMLKANQGYASAFGQVAIEQQRLNNAEGARGDEIVNKAQYYNAQNLTQARIDKANLQEDRDQKKRNYLTALSENLKAILTDESDRAYAKELEPYHERIAALQGMSASRNTV